MRLLTGTLATALMGVLVLSACGDDSDRLSAEQFAGQLGQACAMAFEKGEAALPMNPPPETRLTTTRVNDFAQAMEEFAETVEGLAAPEALEDETATFHTELAALTAEFRQVARKGGSEDEIEQALNGLFPRFGQLETAAKPLGLTPLHTCAGRVVPPSSTP